MELIKLLGFKGFIIFSDLRLLGYMEFVFWGGWGTGWQYLLTFKFRGFKGTR